MRPIAALILFAGLTQAQDVHAQVKAKVAADNHVEAAQLLGKALAAAQRGGDILLVQKRAEILRKEFAKLDPLEDPKKKGGYRDVCHAVMKSLDARRADAFVSAHHLAYELIHQCVRGGDDRYLADAVAVAREFAKQKGVGRHPQLMARLAGAVLMARKKPGQAERELRTIVEYTLERPDGLMAGGLASVELAEILRARGDTDAADAVLDDQRDWFVEDVLPGKADVLAMTYYVDAIAQRRGKAPRVYAASLAKLKSVAKTSFNPQDTRPLGPASPALRNAWKDFPADEPLVSFKGGMLNFEFYDKTIEMAPTMVPPPDSSWAFVEERNGITAAFRLDGVALVRIDFAGRRTRRNGSLLPPRWQFYYRLIGREEWSVTKRGVVTVTPRR